MTRIGGNAARPPAAPEGSALKPATQSRSTARGGGQLDPSATLGCQTQDTPGALKLKWQYKLADRSCRALHITLRAEYSSF